MGAERGMSLELLTEERLFDAVGAFFLGGDLIAVSKELLIFVFVSERRDDERVGIYLENINMHEIHTAHSLFERMIYLLHVCKWRIVEI